ncbi:MAG: ATP-binding protein [bacterium]
MNALDVLKEVDFDWTLHLKSVLEDPLYDVPDLHKELKKDILDEVFSLHRRPHSHSPLGRVMIGIAGAGKTHLLRSLRKEVFRINQWFVLVDMTGVRDFDETVLMGYIDSLQASYSPNKQQHQAVLEMFLFSLGLNKSLHRLANLREGMLIQEVDLIISSALRKFGRDMLPYQDALRALFYFHSNEIPIQEAGYAYLIGFDLDPTERNRLHFRHPRQKPFEIIKALSWIMSVGGATLLALDQLDAIVKRHHLASGSGNEANLNEEQKTSLAIIQNIAGGLSALFDSTCKSLILVSCLAQTWDVLSQKAIASAMHRYRSPDLLRDIENRQLAEQLVRQRLEEAYHRCRFTPPYPSWPFKPEAFDRVVGLTPRAVLQKCYRIRRKFLDQNAVFEVQSFDLEDQRPAPQVVTAAHPLDSSFGRLRESASGLMDESGEDTEAGALLVDVCRWLLKEHEIPGRIDVLIDQSVTGEHNYPSLHARIRLVYRDEGDREEHYGLRVLLRANATAYQNRLRAAMAASGIDRHLSFRKLVILRPDAPPHGPATQRLTQEFLDKGGCFLRPTDADWKALRALRKMEAERLEDWDNWLAARRPVSSLPLFQDAAQWLRRNLGLGGVATGTMPPSSRREDRSKSTPPGTPPEIENPIQPTELFLGSRIIPGQPPIPVNLPLKALAKHAVILAGSGSGKTVLVRRMVEEAALLGVPSIVIDAANDLARLGDPWPQPPDSWSADDHQKAKAYFDNTGVAVWTPGRDSGQPLCLSLLPDLAAVKDDPEELAQAVEMAREALRDVLLQGSSVKAQKKAGVLGAALEYFARHNGQGLEVFVTLLADLPPEAGGGITDAPKLALEMADLLKAAMITNPLLKPGGPPLDPSILLGWPNTSGKTHVSVINFIGLPAQEGQQLFLNQLAMALFTWIKQNPAREGIPLRGLLVLDEAKDYVPSGRSSPCKESLIRLTAQARKYGLGLLFATQAPKSIDHNLIANCTTHFYGQANSPAEIETVTDLLHNKGGSGQDISRMGAGRFYVHSELLNSEIPSAPWKIQVPMCLSHHPANPLEEMDVITRAQASRAKI